MSALRPGSPGQRHDEATDIQLCTEKVWAMLAVVFHCSSIFGSADKINFRVFVDEMGYCHQRILLRLMLRKHNSSSFNQLSIAIALELHT